MLKFFKAEKKNDVVDQMMANGVRNVKIGTVVALTAAAILVFNKKLNEWP